MRRKVVSVLLSLVCAAALAGCSFTSTGGGGIGATAGGLGEREPGVDAVVAALRDLTEELVRKVESAQDAKAGVAEAQRLLDARREEMAAGIAALKRSQAMQDPAARGRWLEAEVENTQRVRELQLKHLDASLRDPELKAGLERLVAGYDSMFKGR